MNQLKNQLQLPLPLLLETPGDARFPDTADRIVIVHPADAPIATIAGQWTRLEDGSVSAYYTPEQLEICRRLDGA